LKNRRFEVGIFALLLAASSAFSAACGSSSADAGRASGGSGGGDAGAAGSGADTQTITLAFESESEDSTLTLDPKESRELTVRAVYGNPTPDQEAPPATQIRIRFALTAEDEAMLDAVLDTNEALTDDEGIAHVTVIAPSRPMRFSVRASNPRSASVLQGLKVLPTGKTTLSVQHAYTGNRPVTEWTATAKAGVSCSDLGSPPRDGDPINSAPLNDPVMLSNVPVGVDLAVTVRAGHYISGCVNVPALSEGDGNQVLVYASDRALNLPATNLSLHFGASDAHPGFDKLLQSRAASAESALLGDAKNDVAALLDDMRATALGLDGDAFDLARDDNDWDRALETAFGKTSARRMRDPAQRWLSAGLAALNAPDALSGKLAALGSGATFTPSSVGGASADTAGLSRFFSAKWSADSSDTVLLGMTLEWQPSRLVTALALAPARAEFPEVSSVADALALSVDCAQVGQVLLAAGASPGTTAFASCDESCTVSACQTAVAAAWARAEQSSGTETDTLSVTATAKATVGDDARATALSGGWVGVLSTESGDAQVSGALSAE